MTEYTNEETGEVNIRTAEEIRRAEELRTQKRKKFLLKQKIFFIIVWVCIISASVLTFLPVFATLNYEYHTNNILHRLKFLYKGEFQTISPHLEDPNMRITPNGLYILRAENGIEFKAVQLGSQISSDYEYYVYKNFVLDYMDKHPGNHVFCEEYTQEGYGNLFGFKFGVDITDYDTIELGMEEMYDLRNSFLSHAEDYFNNKGSFYITVRLKDFEVDLVNYYIKESREHFINEFIFAYANYLRTTTTESGDKLEGYEELNKPAELTIYIDGQMASYYNEMNQFTPLTVKYDLDRKEYRLSITSIEKYIRDFCTFTRYYGKTLDSLVYKDIKYKFNLSDKSNYEITEEKVPVYWSLEQIRDFFGAEVEYDFDKATVYINFNRTNSGNLSGETN